MPEVNRRLSERTSAMINRHVARPVAVRNAELGYNSIVHSYGYKLREFPDGTVIFDPQGIKNRADRFGDRLLRRVDEHVLSKLTRSPGRVWARVSSGPKRSRGNVLEVVANAKRLGLEDYYG